MRRILHHMLAVGVLMALIADVGHVTAQERSEPDIGTIDRYIEEQMAANRVPGLALAITRGDDVLYLEGYGSAGSGRLMTPRTQFYIASLSKSFTALAVMKLVEAGKIELDKPARAYLPNFTTADPGSAGRITVRHLLNQTSGLADAGYPAYTLPQPDSIEERVRSLRDARLVSESGMEFHYTDLNYAVLARIVEVTSGQPFTAYLRNHVFTPLAMTNTTNVITSTETSRVAPNLAQGHIVAFSMPIPHQELDGYLGGSGGVISTAEDMANYLIMQNNGGRFHGKSLVSSESVMLMHTAPRGIDSSYAMGWIAPDPGAEPPVIEHSGVLSAFHADMALLPDDGYGIVLLYNYSYALTNFNGIKQGLIDLLRGEPAGSNALSVGTLGILLAGLTVISAALQVRGLRGSRQWAAQAKDVAPWRLVPGIVWQFVPMAVLIGMQSLVALFAGRVFSFHQLYLSMPDVMLWLTLSAVLGISTGAARVIIMVRRREERAT
jgi:CubicO group peptidase (beta-lactamase class C family)